MSVYTVHSPPPRKDETAAAPERFVFVRDGFYFWAFLFGPLWMLWRRLWLVALLYLIAAIVLQIGLWAVGANSVTRFIVGFLLALLIGFEAGSLQRWTLTRRGWQTLDVVVGDDLEMAERRFFSAWLPAEPVQSSLPPAPQMPISRSMARATLQEARDIIGLFPESGAPR